MVGQLADGVRAFINEEMKSQRLGSELKTSQSLIGKVNVWRERRRAKQSSQEFKSQPKLDFRGKQEAYFKRRLAKCMGIESQEVDSRLIQIKQALSNSFITQKQICKRYRLTPYYLKQIKEYFKHGRTFTDRKYFKLIAFKRVYERTKEHIRALLTTKRSSPLSLAQILKEVKGGQRLKFSKQQLWRLMKQELDCCYSKALPVPCRINYMSSMMQRQVAASHYIKFLLEGKELLNIDESCLHWSDHRSRSWRLKSTKSYFSSLQRLSSLNITAAVSNKGAVYFTLNRGSNTSLTFKSFLLKLIKFLDEDTWNWRSQTIIILDNAAIHKSRVMMDFYSKFKLPIMFLGPYSFEMAPVECFFSFIKSKNLNQANINLSSQYL